ncbi:YTH domain-containing protein ECT2-like [Impatiens glandulifera]|uniref:YTH domain-containing protein ECT2-like n=1 Tax=Impatiens glandulifera TaxID=253017 RepID=UPI001FB16D18|nr:YTH domain-containing protein ECT2-like [Impatiens glandulifera]
MASVAPPADQAAEYMQKLNLNPEAKTEVADKGKKYNSGVLANGLNKPYERSVTPLLHDYVDPNMLYLPNAYPYYYGGNEWDYRFPNKDGFEMPHGAYNNLYSQGYGYAPYGAYPPPGSPVPNISHESQLYYQYLSAAYQQSLTPSNGSNAPHQAKSLQSGVSTSKVADQMPVTVDTAKVPNAGGNLINMPKPIRPNHHKSTWLNASTLTDVKSKYAPGSHGNNFSNGRNQSLHPFSHNQPRQTLGMNQAGLMDRMYPNSRIYNQYANFFRNGGYGLSNYDRKINGRGWMGIDSRWKPKGRDNGCFSNATAYDGLNELNRGPRTKPFKNQMELEQNNEEKLSAILDLDQYNKEDFPEVYKNAKFFIIKSYSEDDVHKSVKYGVWASTPNGNKKLDAAYREAQEVAGGCPVFLLFSVNASGQFVGVAEMTNTVDFDNSVEYWQQDKWTGCFTVKWSIVKDTPNSLFKHIILANNENKPVTNSRDTQEVKLEQGIEMLKIFKSHSSKTCILDDFGFYEARQKVILEKKAKQQQYNKRIVDDKESPLAVPSVLVEDSSVVSTNVATAAEAVIEEIVKTQSIAVESHE